MHAIEANNSDHVLCERLGSEEFKVISQDSKCFVVESLKTKKRHEIYKFHCHMTTAVKMANRARRQIRASQIGAKKG